MSISLQRQTTTKVEDALVVLAFLLSTGNLNPFITSSFGGLDINQIVLLALYCGAALLLARNWRESLAWAGEGTWLWLLMGFVMISVFWSDSPSTSLARSLGLLGGALFGLYLATRYDLKRLIRLLSWAICAATVLSIVFVLVLPDHGKMTGWNLEGDWRGIYAQKNTLARVMALGSIVMMLRFFDKYEKRARMALWFLLMQSVLWMADSATGSVISLSLIAVLLPFYRVQRTSTLLRLTLWSFVSIVVVASSLLVIENLSNILEWFGRDLTLTGRTDVWSAVLEQIRRSPWVGYGYGGFWLGWSGPSANVWLTSGWEAGDSHNGFLDLLLDVGSLGTIIFVLGLARNYMRSFQWVRRAGTGAAIFPAAFLTCMLLYNLTESAILRPTNLFWILYATITMSKAMDMGNATRLSGHVS